MGQNKKISEETAVTTLTGDELIRGVQGGANVKITIDQINEYVANNVSATGVASVNGDEGPDVTISKATVGLANVDNTADSAKPVSVAQSDADAMVLASANAFTAVHVGNTNNPHSVTKAQVGLANADNTSDVDKPVSTAQAAADAVIASALSAHAGNTGNPHGTTAAQVGLGNVENKSSATIRGEITSGNVTTALGYTPENAAQKGAAGGYAPLDGTGKVASTYLPSYVDDVLEFANLAAFPGTGETGKMYVALDTNKVYRWSGSAYVEISGSPGSTDAVPEGASNLYFTAARVLATVLSGLSTATNAVITAADTVLSALGKLQKQISDNLTTLTNHTGNTSNPHSTTAAQVGAAASGAVTTSGLTMSTARLLGRNTGSTGAIEEITLGTNLSMTGTTLNATGGAGDFKSDGTVAMTGAISTAVGTFSSSVANGASAVGFDYNTAALTTAGALIGRWRNNGVTKASIDKDGKVAGTGATATSVALGFTTQANTGLFNHANGHYIGIAVNGYFTHLLDPYRTQLHASTIVAWSKGVIDDSLDVGLARNADGRIEVNNSVHGTLRDVVLRSLISNGNIARGIVRKTSNYTVTANDSMIECDASSGAITLTLPAAASTTPGATYTLKKIDSSANAVIWDGNASETIDGSTTVQTTTQWVSITIICNAAGTAWLTIKD